MIRHHFRKGDPKRYCEVRTACDGERLSCSTWSWADAARGVLRCKACASAYYEARRKAFPDEGPFQALREELAEITGKSI